MARSSIPPGRRKTNKPRNENLWLTSNRTSVGRTRRNSSSWPTTRPSSWPPPRRRRQPGVCGVCELSSRARTIAHRAQAMRAIAGNERPHPLAHAHIPAHGRDAHVRIGEILHASKLHTRRHRPLRRTRECRVINRDAIKESRRPGSRRGLAAGFQFDGIADHRRFELPTPVEVQPVAKRLRQNETAVLSKSVRGHVRIVAADDATASRLCREGKSALALLGRQIRLALGRSNNRQHPNHEERHSSSLRLSPSCS